MKRTAEGTGSTLEEATAAALTQLGVAEGDAQIEVLAHPRRGFFGGGRSARVRATAQTTGEAATEAGSVTKSEPATEASDLNDDAPRQEDRVTDPSTNQEEAEETTGEASAQEDAERPVASTEEELTPQERLDLLDEEAEIAADFLEGLLDLLDLPGDIEINVREEQAIVNIAEVGSGLLIGRRGATLDALQELVRCATQRRTERRSHVRVDVEGYRERQLEKLRDKCRDAIAQVRETQESVRLEPMDPYERKMMHDLVAKSTGVTSSSEGNEPRRRVVIEPEG